MDKTKLAVDVFDRNANLYQEKFMDLHGYHSSLDLFCAALKKQGAEILEIGCGPGNISQYLLQKRPDFNLLGTDLSPNMLELAKKNNPKAAFELMDCRDLFAPRRKFDGLVCGFCFPYISKEDVLKLIADAGKILNEDGVIYISTMEDDYAKSDFKAPSSGEGPAAFIYYHEAGYLNEALRQNHFEILEERRVISTDATDLLLIGKLKKEIEID